MGFKKEGSKLLLVSFIFLISALSANACTLSNGDHTCTNYAGKVYGPCMGRAYVTYYCDTSGLFNSCEIKSQPTDCNKCPLSGSECGEDACCNTACISSDPNCVECTKDRCVGAYHVQKCVNYRYSDLVPCPATAKYCVGAGGCAECRGSDSDCPTGGTCINGECHGCRKETQTGCSAIPCCFGLDCMGGVCTAKTIPESCFLPQTKITMSAF